MQPEWSSQIKMVRLGSAVALSLTLALIVFLSAALGQGGSAAQFDSTPVNVGTPINNVWDVVTADLDGDGDLDLVSASSGLEIWRNNGDGTWTSYYIYPGSFKLAVGDIDNDGDLDIATDNGFFLVVLQHDGDPWTGSWSANNIDPVVDVYNSMALADLDGDGDLDLATAAQNGPVQIWENDGTPFDGLWTSNLVGTVAPPLMALAVGDLDSDGDPDIVSGNRAGNMNAFTAWENDGSPFSGTWAGNANSLFGQTLAITIGDLDQDGKIDIVVGDSNGHVESCRNDGIPFVGSWVCINAGNVGIGVDGMALGDADDDGDLDIVTGDGNSSNNMRLWTNDGSPFSGAWPDVTLGSLDQEASAVALGDLDIDGDLDVVAGNYTFTGPKTLMVWENILVHRSREGYLPFEAPTMVVSGTLDYVYAIAAVDLDNDGDQDFVLGQQHGLQMLRRDGGASWTSKWLGSIGDLVYSVVPADIDRDGDLDLVIGRDVTTDNVQIWVNPLESGGDIWVGDAPWSLKTVGTANGPVQAIAVGDLDQNGTLDIATGCVATTGNVQVWWHDGDPIAGTWSANAVGTAYQDSVESLALGDLDHDGYLDLVSGSSSAGNGYLDVWHNDGSPFTGTWSNNGVGSVAASTITSIALADLNADGNLDLVSGSYHVAGSANVNAWQNDGSPFADPWPATDLGETTGDVFAVTVADLDADGDVDVVASGAGGGNLAAWKNDGSPFDLIPWVSFGLDEGIDHYARVAIAADVNDDGRWDIVSGSYDWSPPDSNYQLQVWSNVGAPVKVVPADTAPATMNPNEVDDLLRISVSHNGVIADSDVELAWWDVQFTDGSGTPLTTAQAQALFANLYVYREEGSTPGFQDLEDTPVIVQPDIALSLSDGIQRFTFPDGDARARIGGTSTATYYVVAALQSSSSDQMPHIFHAVYDPDDYTRAENADVNANLRVEAASPFQSKMVSVLNHAPLLSSVSVTPSLVRPGDPITVTTSGAGDPDGDQVALKCGASSGNYDLGMGTYGSGERSFTFASPWTDDLTHSIWCVVTDGGLDSAEHTATVTADNTAPAESSYVYLPVVLKGTP
jgi:hypothetical protein